MTVAPVRSFGAHLKVLRETAGFTQEELATIAGLSVHAVSALERGERKRPYVETVRSLSAALDLSGPARDALIASARAPVSTTAVEELSGSTMPVPLTRLLGREHDLAALRTWIADPSARLITLVGTGGVGKTRLALELGREVADEGVTHVAFVPLAVIRDPAFVASAIAESVGLADVSARDLPRRVRAACDDHPTLMVLDNFEHVLDAVPIVADLLISAPSLRLLVTSRAPLRVRGEREYAVGPLALDAATESASDNDAPAVRLFVERVRDARPDFRLTPVNRDAVTAICRRLDALPLALELAAPWIKVLTPDDLLRRLEHDALFSAEGPRDLPERQRTMNSTVAWSYHLLDADDQRAFRRFGALPAFFPIDAAAAVLGGDDGGATIDAALQAAARLIDKSLLQRADPAAGGIVPQYQMLETVRAYAMLQLTASGERDQAMESLVRYCTEQSELAMDALSGPAQVEWLHRVRANLDCIRSVLAWLLEGGRSEEASVIASGVAFFWLIRGHSVEGLQWYEQVLSRPPLPARAEARMLMGAALMCYAQGNLTRAREALTGTVALAREAADWSLQAQAEHLFGHAELAVGNIAAATTRFTNSVDQFKTLGIAWGIGAALTGMAWVALSEGNVPLVERLLDEATEVLRAAGPWFMSLVRYLRALLAVHRGDADAAIASMRDSLVHIREVHDKFAFVYALIPLSAAAILKGNDEWAARLLGARDAVTERTGATVVDKSAHAMRDQTERDVRIRLGPDRWAAAYASGREASIDMLLKEIDSLA